MDFGASADRDPLPDSRLKLRRRVVCSSILNCTAWRPHPAHWADLAGHGRHFLGSLQEEGSMPTQTTDLFLLEDLEETRSKREPLVRARRAATRRSGAALVRTWPSG